MAPNLIATIVPRLTLDGDDLDARSDFNLIDTLHAPRELPRNLEACSAPSPTNTRSLTERDGDDIWIGSNAATVVKGAIGLPDVI